MKLIDVLELPRGIPLSQVVKNPSAAGFFGLYIFKIGEGVYLRLSPYKPGSLEKSASGPFVNAIVWGASDGAVRRALLMELEADDWVSSSAPDEFLPAEGAKTYGTILGALRKARPRVCQEKAAYRIASDGQFVHRIIETERSTFCFRSPMHDGSDNPYVIIRRLEEA